VTTPKSQVPTLNANSKFLNHIITQSQLSRENVLMVVQLIVRWMIVAVMERVMKG